MNKHSKPHKWRRLSSRVVFTHPRIVLAEDFQQIGWFYADNRRTSAKLYVVCARGAFRDNYSLQPDDTEFISSSWLEIGKLELKLGL